MENICYSGGAIGADSEWSIASVYNDHDVCHMSFEGHKISPEARGDVVILSKTDLLEAKVPVAQVAQYLRKAPPSKPYTRNLIFRNYFQIKNTDAVYGVGSIVDGFVQGGTAWAVYMYILCTNAFRKQIYFFDQNTEKWYQYTSNPYPWFEIEKPPKPEGKWTGIGTRNLTDAGNNAIWNVFED